MNVTRPIPLPILGIDMLSNETALINGTVREAVNVDIDRAGRFRRRAGQTLRVPGYGYHSIWGSQQRGIVLVGKNNELYRLKKDFTTEFVASLNSAELLSYTEYNGNIYWTNRTTIGWIPSDSMEARPVGVPVPETAPTLSASNGTLSPGTYAVVISFLDDRREEGGTTEVQTIHLPNGGGIKLDNLPVINGWFIRIYITDPDSSVFHRSDEIPAVFPSYTVTQIAKGGDCNTQFLRPMPPGEFITWLAGRLYTAKDNVLYFSEAMRPHQYDPAHNFISFSGQISFIESVTDGIYVGDSRGVWFLLGTDPTKFEMRFVSPHRAVKRSSVKVGQGFFADRRIGSPNPVVVWLSSAGYVVGMDNGVTIELQADRVRINTNSSGRTIIRTINGIKQLLTLIK